jgi:hypothetical protein
MQCRTPATATPVPRLDVPLDENGLVDWLIDAKPGDRVVYYRGHLGHDRMPSAKVLDWRVRTELHAVANRVMVLAGQGLVLPVQKRVGPEDCLYIAVKAQPQRRSSTRQQDVPLTQAHDLNHAVPLAA